MASPSSSKRSRRPAKKRLSWISRIVLLVILLVILVGTPLVLYYGILLYQIPDITSLKDYQPALATRILAEEGTLIGLLFQEKRILVPLSDLPPLLIQAFIASEDSRFFKHRGLDFLSILRAVLKNIWAGEIVQGGSTITQQVTKSLLLTPEKSYSRKIKEALLAYRLDQNLSKEEILFIYLNQIYLGHGAYGIEAAAQTYFGKKARQLSLSESALLAGLPQAPSRYSPLLHPKKAKERQGYVLTRMAEEGFISETEALQAAGIPLAFNKNTNLNQLLAPHLIDMVRKFLFQAWGSDRVLNAGLVVQTTLDPLFQEAALAAVKNGTAQIQKRRNNTSPGQNSVEGALLCIEGASGAVKALVGGKDHSLTEFNRVVQSRRQPGSAFKPIIYSAAIDKGFTPATELNDAPLSFGGPVPWHPQNFDLKFLGPTTLRTALIQSRNIVSIKILQRIGVTYAVDYAKRLGITSALYPNLSLALGASGISLWEMVTAYNCFPNGGRRVSPYYIKRITDRTGRVLYEHQPKIEPVLDPDSAYIMTHLLEGVVKEGTGWRLKALGRPVAGKTGTTNEFRDAWFIGFTPQVTAGVWVGIDDLTPLGQGETGAQAAAPIFLEFFQKALTAVPALDFPVPPGIVFQPMKGAGKDPRNSGLVMEAFKGAPEKPAGETDWER